MWITIWYHLKPFITGMIDRNVDKELLRSCASLNLRLLSFNIPERCPLQTYFNTEISSSLIFALFVPTRLDVIMHGQYFTCNHVLSIKACITHQISRTFTVLSTEEGLQCCPNLQISCYVIDPSPKCLPLYHF